MISAKKKTIFPIQRHPCCDCYSSLPDLSCIGKLSVPPDWMSGSVWDRWEHYIGVIFFGGRFWTDQCRQRRFCRSKYCYRGQTRLEEPRSYRDVGGEAWWYTWRAFGKLWYFLWYDQVGQWSPNVTPPCRTRTYHPPSGWSYLYCQKMRWYQNSGQQV